MIKNVKRILTALITLATFFCAKNVAAQASTEKFGQNKIQYQNFKWSYYDSTHFRVFFYRPSEKLAEHILDEAERDLSNIVEKMGGSLPRKLNIVLYNSYSDYIQSNIGVNQTSDLNDADGGRLNVSGDNLPIYFTGNHTELKNQVREGVTNVIKDKLLFGNNLKDIVKSAMKMNLPEWYTTGYVAFISKEWTPLIETEVQNIAPKDSNFKFAKIASQNAELIGHSFWYFLNKQYGSGAVSNLLYISRFKQHVDAALAQTLGKDAKIVYEEWRKFYALPNHLLAEENNFGRSLITKVKAQFEGKYSQFLLSPNAKQLAYVLKKDGEWKIIIQETDLGDFKVLASGGFKNLEELQDPSYPILAWSPSGKKLATLYALKNETLLRIYNTSTQRKQNKLLSKRKIERITGISFTDDENTLIFSGIKKGKSDLFSYSIIHNRLTNLTNDYYDDYAPTYISSGNKTGILFLSNRVDTVLNEQELEARDYFNKSFNIFYFNQKNRASLQQVTHSEVPILSPIQYGLDKFSYIQNENGKLVRKLIEVQNINTTGAVQFNQETGTPLPFNILQHHYVPKQESLVEVIKKNNEYYIYNTKVKDLEVYDAENQIILEKEETNNKKLSTKQSKAANYISRFDEQATLKNLQSYFQDKIQAADKDLNHLVSIKPLQKKYKYKTTFSPKVLATSLDNTLLFTRYQNVAYNKGGFQVPDLNGFLSFELIDQLEDQRITGGIRVPASFDGISYFLQYANYKKRTNWKVTYFHQQNNQVFAPSEAPPPFVLGNNFLGRVSTEYLEGTLRYPFNRANSVQVSTGVRYDRVRYLAIDPLTIQFPNDHEYWSFMRAEYIFDNTINPIINIRKGSRAKIFAEYQYRLNKNKTGFYQIGFDARNYHPIYKNIILASRAATGLSDGSAKLLYYLGGVDNPLELNNNRGAPPSNLSDYAFQTLATNLRGYKLQAFNGSSYVVINEEIRLPIYSTFFKRPLKSAFLQNFQLIAFVDVGAAWRGFLPLDKNINPRIITASSNITASYVNNQDVMGVGYGTGVRTKLLGYFMRLDVAWNIEKEETKPRIHLSMATDF